AGVVAVAWGVGCGGGVLAVGLAVALAAGVLPSALAVALAAGVLSSALAVALAAGVLSSAFTAATAAAASRWFPVVSVAVAAWSSFWNARMAVVDMGEKTSYALASAATPTTAAAMGLFFHRSRRRSNCDQACGYSSLN